MKYYIWTAWYFYLDWKWIFYPENLSTSKFLNFYSQNFNFLEINSSFYRIPWKNYKTYLKYDLVYAVKAYKAFTHFKKLDIDLINSFMKNLQELIEKDKLKVILFQYPSSFKFTEENFDYIRKTIDYFIRFSVKLSFEFRHNSWFEKENLDKLKNIITRNINIVHTDWFFYSQLIIWPWINLWWNFDYFRFHGRWAKKYYYDYSNLELKEISERIKEISKNKEEVYISFNNTIKANAVYNAKKLSLLLNN
jgi:uncharacterized protein YecE (DUF72 family)